MNDWERRAKFAVKKEVLQEFEGWGNQDFIEYILQLRELIEVQKSALPGLESKNKETGIKAEVKESQFNKEWSIPTQIVFILHLSNKPLLSSEIYTMITRLDKSFKDFMNAETVLSNYLSRSVKSGRIKKIKLPGIRTLYFILPEWVKESGELKDEYHSMIKLF
jgi:hypothetical protein